MQPKVSIILPIYNAGEFLIQCIESLINQTLKDIEIIVILDCPTDGSDKIIEKYAANDYRIKIIRNEQNLHIGESRNIGIKQATGEYIGFCDHDDYCEPNMFELMYHKAHCENLDIVGCNFIRKFINKKGITEKKNNLYLNNTFDKLRKDSMKEIIRKCGYVWRHLFKTDFLKENNILFVDTKQLQGEDIFFSLLAHFYSQRQGFIPDYLYYHLQYSKSTSASQVYSSLKSVIVFLEYMHSLLVKLSLYNDYRQVYIEQIIRRLYTCFLRAIRQNTLKIFLSDITLIKKSQILKENINYLFKSKYLFTLFKKKPTAIIFLLALKLMKQI